MRILSRYVLRRFLFFFVIVVMGLAAGVLIAEMLLHLDDLIGQDGGVSSAVRYLGLKFSAYYLPILIPIASFAAAFLSLGLSARWLELMAAKAGGISPIRAALPLLGGAIVLAGLTLVVDETLVLGAEREWRRLDSPDTGRIEFRRGSFWYQNGNFIYNVGRAEPESRTLYGVTIFEMNDHWHLIRRIQAKSVRIESERWMLEDAAVRHFDPDEPRTPPTLELLPTLDLHADGSSDRALLDADAATLSLGDLRRYIDARERAGDDVSRFRARLHQRLTDPLTVLILALLAIPFAVMTERTQSLAQPALRGALVVLIFWSARELSSVVAQRGLAAIVAPWLTLLLFTFIGVWRLARIPR